MSADRPRLAAGRRFASACVLAPPTLAAVYLGPPFLDLLVTAAAFAMAWEWDRLCGGGRFGTSGWAAVAALAVSGGAAWAGLFAAVPLALLLGAAAAGAAAAVSRRAYPGWTAAAPVVIGLPCACMVWLRSTPEDGLQTTVWLLGTLWVTDLAAFFSGRAIGGPKLAPRLSPRKTWAGLLGGVACSTLWGGLCGFWFGAGSPGLIAVVGGGAAVVAQTGDLTVSSLKRRFGAKDASNLIPGHGGVLDRLDGMLTAAPASVGFVLLSGKGIFV